MNPNPQGLPPFSSSQRMKCAQLKALASVFLMFLLGGCYFTSSHQNEDWAKPLIGEWRVERRMFYVAPEKAGWGVEGFLFESPDKAPFRPITVKPIEVGRILAVTDVLSARLDSGVQYVLVGEVMVEGRSTAFAVYISRDIQAQELPWRNASAPKSVPDTGSRASSR